MKHSLLAMTDTRVIKRTKHCTWPCIWPRLFSACLIACELFLVTWGVFRKLPRYINEICVVYSGFY